LYPICHGIDEILAIVTARLDLQGASVHFWDPMLNRFVRTGSRALESAAMALAGSMMFTTIITMTTRKRGAFG
jgi:hypothetical protein